MQSPPVDTVDHGPGHDPSDYRAGTLVYTKATLFVLFGWLLWGDFCYTMFENIGGPNILKLYLQQNYRVPNKTMYWLFEFVPQMVGLMVVPWLSFNSDRHRGPNGRRLPYIKWTTPFLCLFAALLGCSDLIMRSAKDYVGDGKIISPVAAGVVVIGFLVMGFTFFNDFVNSVFWYLFADVVPHKFMGRFSAMFRGVGSAAGFLTNTWIGERALSDMRWVHIGGALVYLIGFSLMTANVKEGEYPPVTDVTPRTPFSEKLKLYFRECFTRKVFWWVYLSSFFFVFARVSGSPVFTYNLSRHVASTTTGAGRIMAMASSADGRRAISGGDEGRVCLWDARQPQRDPQPVWDAVHRWSVKQATVLRESGPAVSGVAISDDGKFAAVGDASGNVRLWRWPDDASLPPATEDLPHLPAAVTALALSPDGARLAVADADNHLQVWATSPARLLHDASAAVAINVLAFSHDAAHLACAAGNEVGIYDVESGGLLRTIDDPGRVYCMTFMPSLAAPPGGPPQPVSRALWHQFTNYVSEMLSDESLYREPADQRSCVRQPDAWLACAGQDSGNDSKYALARIFDVQSGQTITQMRGHKEAITAIAYKPDLHALLTASRDGTLRLWDPANLRDTADDQSLRDFGGYEKKVTAVAVPATGQYALSGDAEGAVHLWDLDAGVSQKKYSHMSGFFQLFVVLMAFPCGLIIDRWHPIRVTFWAAFVVMWAPLYYYFFLRDYIGIFAAEVIKVPMYTLITAAGLPMTLAIFPRDKYGQFSSANALIRIVTSMGVGFASSALMDSLTRSSLLTDNYRYGSLWSFAGMAGYQVALYLIYRHWKQQGCPNDLRESAPSLLAPGEVAADTAPSEPVPAA